MQICAKSSRESYHMSDLATLDFGLLAPGARCAGTAGNRLGLNERYFDSVWAQQCCAPIGGKDGDAVKCVPAGAHQECGHDISCPYAQWRKDPTGRGCRG